MFSDDMTHTTKIVINGIYLDKEIEQIALKIAGDGSIDYFIDVFRAALVAFGFEAETAERLVLKENEYQ